MITYDVGTVDHRLPAVKFLLGAHAYVLMFEAGDPDALTKVERRYHQLKQVVPRLLYLPQSPLPVVLTVLVDANLQREHANRERALADRLRCAYAEVPTATSADSDAAQRQLKDVLDLARERTHASDANSSSNDGETIALGWSTAPTVPRAEVLSSKDTRRVRIAVVGPSFVGKTRLVASLRSRDREEGESEHPAAYEATIQETTRADLEVDGRSWPLEVVETGGNEACGELVAEQLLQADVCIAVYDPQRGGSLSDLCRMLDTAAFSAEMQPHGQRMMPPMVLVALSGASVVVHRSRIDRPDTVPDLIAAWTRAHISASTRRPDSMDDVFRTALQEARIDQAL